MAFRRRTATRLSLIAFLFLPLLYSQRPQNNPPPRLWEGLMYCVSFVLRNFPRITCDTIILSLTRTQHDNQRKKPLLHVASNLP